MSSCSNPESRQRGITLIELMIAVAIGSIIVAVVFGSFVSTRQSLRAAEIRIARHQDARSALQILARDLRMAGNFGCAALGERGDDWLVVNRGGSSAWQQVDQNSNGLRGVSKGSKDAGTWLGSLTPESDLLIVQYGQGAFSVSSRTLNATGDAVTGLTFQPAEQGDWANWTRLVLASCTRIDVLASGSGMTLGSSGGSQTLTLDEAHALPLKGDSHPDGHQLGSLEVMALVSRAYFVAEVDGVKQLLRREMLADGSLSEATLVADGVASLAVDYGVLDDCDADSTPRLHYAGAGEVGDWQRVGTVRLTLTLQQPSAVRSGQTVSAAYPLTVALRGGVQCAHRPLAD
ncbi:PilW family protein [Pseudogulbenkiania sp. MAI-1]|uniref:PilW family protein n=1 Tax=Pseudogulbenkiania sp. MAI-1 TaxID=990370 RepID=UPI00045EA553|nr:PilW family protein [Pseudogulbenkiania sp. MAI-1]